MVMRLLQLDELMISYTNAGAQERAWYTSSMVLGTRYPYGKRSDSGAPMDERQVRAVRSRRCSNAESTTPGSSAGTQVPWSVFSPSMASFLKRTANASFVPRLLSIGPSMSASVYRGLRGCNLRCRGRVTHHSYKARRKPENSSKAAGAERQWTATVCCLLNAFSKVS